MDSADNAPDISQYEDAPLEGQADDVNLAPADTEVEEESAETEAPEEQAEDGTTFEELAQKKGFRTPNDLAKAYRELESHTTKVQMDRAELLKARGGDPKGKTVQPGSELEKEVRAIKERVEINELFSKYTDAKDYSKQMAEHIKEHPNASWEQAYRYVKFDDLAKTSKQEGRREAYQNIDQKAKIISEKPAPRKAPKKDLASLIKDRTVPLAEIEKLLPHG